jgi:hypothetical protein
LPDWAAAAALGWGAVDESAIIVEATAAACLAASEVPHILQKFMPGGLTVPHAAQTGPAACAGLAAGAAASRRWPQSWQNSEPSRLTLPQ